MAQLQLPSWIFSAAACLMCFWIIYTSWQKYRWLMAQLATSPKMGRLRYGGHDKPRKMGVASHLLSLWSYTENCVVVSNMFCFHLYLGEEPILTIIVFKWVGSTTNDLFWINGKGFHSIMRALSLRGCNSFQP